MKSNNRREFVSTFRVIDDFKRETIKWYTLIRCAYRKDAKQEVIHLPASFLKMRNLLPDNVKIIEEDVFNVNFNAVKGYWNKIDEIYCQAMGIEAYPKEDELLSTFRDLYREQTGTKDYYGKTIDQAQRQFRKEYAFFFKMLQIDENILKKAEYKVRVRFELELHKMFVLYKYSKVNGGNGVFNINGKYLSKDNKIINLDNILSVEKNNVSVAPLDGYDGSTNSIFIEKIYALLWLSLDEKCYEEFIVIDFINDLEEITRELIYTDMEEVFFGAIRKLNHYCTDEKIKEVFLKEFIDLINKKASKAYDSLISKKMLVSVGAYWLLKIYIDDKIKKITWRILISRQTDKFEGIKVSSKQLQNIYNCTRSIKIVRESDFINMFNDKYGMLTNEQKNDILDLIFPNDNRRKDEKRAQLANHFRKYNIIYLISMLNQRAYEDDEKINHCYNLIIACSIYFHNKQISFHGLTSKNFNSRISISHREKIIYDYINKIAKCKIDKSALKEGYIDLAYLEMVRLIVLRYRNLFEQREQMGVRRLDAFADMVYSLIREFWQCSLDFVRDVTLIRIKK